MGAHWSLRGPAVGLATFAAMEGVSYGTHRWVMHGPAMAWHRSHHRPGGRGPEPNDLFPLFFSGVGAGLFAVGARRSSSDLTCAAIGMSTYGAAYLYVHEIHIHRRFRLPIIPTSYFAWLREAHADHHRGGTEPFGMLLPVVRHGPRRPRRRPSRH